MGFAVVRWVRMRYRYDRICSAVFALGFARVCYEICSDLLCIAAFGSALES